MSGVGDVVLLLHCSVVADACRPLLEESVLTAHWRLAHYYRRGWGTRPAGEDSLDIPSQAADAAAIARDLGSVRVHLIGHSIGAHIALQIARAFPGLVRSMVLMEPVFAEARSGEEVKALLLRVAQTYSLDTLASGSSRVGDGPERRARATRAVDLLLSWLSGTNYREVLDRRLPAGWFERALSQCPIYFERELPAAVAWDFHPADATALPQPVLLLSGAFSPPVFRESQELLASFLPHAHAMVIQGAAHFLPTEAPGRVARAAADFFAAHQD